MKIYVDSETLGLHGPCKLIQWSVEREPVKFIKLPTGWQKNPPEELYDLLELMMRPDTTFVGYNTTFDLWHLYRVFEELLGKRLVQPFNCKVLDLYNHCMLKGPFAAWAFSSRGSRSGSGKAVAAVRKVPRVAAEVMKARVGAALKERLPMGELICSEHEVKGRPDLITLSWTTNISLGLKAHAEYWGAPVIKLKDVWPLPKRDDEKGWLNSPYDNGALLPVYETIREQCDAIINGPETSEFYQYAKNDIEYLWLVEDKMGVPTPTHDDTCTAIVAYTRYFGYDVDRHCIGQTVVHYKSELRRIESLLKGCDLKSHHQRTALLKQYNPIIQSSKKEVLLLLAKRPDECGVLADAMLKYGSAKQKLDQTLKVQEAGCLYADLRVLGTATGRMAGTGSFNVQGIGKPEEDADGNVVGIRESLYTAGVGDFHQFELAIAASAWGDERMLSDLASGIDIHLATACDCHPKLVELKLSYEEAKKAKKSEAHPLHSVVDKARTECKRMVFGILYGCTEQKIADVFSVTVEEAKGILLRFYQRYPGIFEFKQRIERRFCTADTTNWTRDSVLRMADSETDLTGYTRYWKFEKQVASIFWELGNRWPNSGVMGTITRQTEKGPQSIDQACRSACLGAAIAIQQAVYRQAANMKIQTTGAQLCKKLAAVLWDTFKIPMLNIHDELVFARHPNFNYKAVESLVLNFVKEWKPVVTHLRFDLTEAQKWSEKA